MGSISKKEEIISNRLKRLEEILGLKPSEMADMGGCSQATYYRYRKGESTPDSIFLNNIIKNKKIVRAEWLLTGQGPVLETDDSEDHIKPSKIEFINLPLYNMKPRGNSSEGHMLLEDWKNPSYTLPLCNVFLDGILEADSSQLFAMRVRCDSMSPEIKPGSLVIGNEDETDITSDGMYIVRYDNIVRMKLVQLLPEDQILLTTLNKKYDPVKVNFDKSDVEILGRIIWVGTPYQ